MENLTDKIIAEYALHDLAKPVGVSSYVVKLVESLPAAFRGSLPSPEQLKAELRTTVSAGPDLRCSVSGPERSEDEPPSRKVGEGRR